jgi:lysyl-tRNA synthetase class 2
VEPIDNLRRIRIEKLEAIKKTGVNPYPAKFEKKDNIFQAKNSFGKEVTVAGRIVGLRPHGKLTFVDLLDETGKIQVAFQKDKLKDYSFLENLDLGDFLGVSGIVDKTVAGETTVFAEDFTLLSKALLPLPSTWYGLKDVETRFRKKYLDLLINEDVKKIATNRAKILLALRKFLDEKDFIELETPILQPIYGGAAAKPFKTRYNALGQDFFLRISDELYLKRAIIGGFEKVFEIGKDFRNEGIDKTHSPEFTMLELYQAYADYEDMMKLTETMFEYVAVKILGTAKVEFEGKKVDFSKPWKKIPMKEALKIYAKIDVDKLSDEALKKEIKKHGLKYENEPSLTGVAAGFSRGVAIATLFEMVTGKLIEPTFVTDFPRETTALCKLHRNDQSLIERFEPYVFGIEMGNAYSELNDPLVQKEFFDEQQKAKKSGDEEAHPMDEDFLEALEYGMPPTGGLGIGIDRLVMILTGVKSIREAILFPTLKSEK